MSIGRSTTQGFALFFAVFGALAMGCVTAGDGASEGAAPAGAAVEAFHDGPSQDKRWRGNECPSAIPIVVDAAMPSHPFPGRCAEPQSLDQAISEGAREQLRLRCEGYCGQSIPACGARARLLELGCVDRDVGHVWKALCGCDS
jgi:hypothetical protein